MSNRKQLLAVLTLATETFPQLRVGQLLVNALQDPDAASHPDIYYVSDGEMVEAIQGYIAEFAPAEPGQDQ